MAAAAANWHLTFDLDLDGDECLTFEYTRMHSRAHVDMDPPRRSHLCFTQYSAALLCGPKVNYRSVRIREVLRRRTETSRVESGLELQLQCISHLGFFTEFRTVW